ncbi:MAG TPA: nicotinic acid mononucleotide adenylyltransferase, partial [Sphingorhabdus sp.]|nr:nicotinic acid mononucleotide adenylyltransferase [Sphingorhabdus sp.]
MKTIGLMGGSFNPGHGGHRSISLFAVRVLQLDE